ncbi:adenine phosphoribosyltransferase [Sporosalibacterium faouarense]|uniref:adenine phosphoribosyltransferase n=1 Tax=Sporosalibacterium faouarense TaxID=516123 RepID=UPI00192B46D0|nr:adenine phosphoribosyltransferase [Sporosalibacterium faouarense]
MDLRTKIRSVKDFPKEGIDFKDITTVLKDKEAFRQCIDQMADLISDIEVDIIVGPEARGFLTGAPMAYKLGAGFVPVRKPGKLPAETISYEYELEYGTDILEIHKDSIKPGEKVVIVDDLLATGGTVLSTMKLIEELGGEVVGVCFFIELEFLKGRDILEGYNVQSLIKF